MNKASVSDVLTKVDTLREAVVSLTGTVMTLSGNVERGLKQHSAALLELSAATAEHTVMHRADGAALERIERRQRSETRTLDDHERRINVLERRT